MESAEATQLRYIGVELRKIAQTLDAICKVLDAQNRLLQRMTPMSPTDMTPDDAETARDWESIQVNDSDKTERLRIDGGWLYRTIVSDETGIAVALTAMPTTHKDDD
jgi:hypothetical protein